MLIQIEEMEWKEGEFDMKDKMISFANKENSSIMQILIEHSELLVIYLCQLAFCKLHSCSSAWILFSIPLLSTSARTWKCPHGDHTELPYRRCHRRHHIACLAGRGILHTSGCILGVSPIMEVKMDMHLYSQVRDVDGLEKGLAGLGVICNLSSNAVWGLALVLLSSLKTPLDKRLSLSLCYSD